MLPQLLISTTVEIGPNLTAALITLFVCILMGLMVWLAVREL